MGSFRRIAVLPLTLAWLALFGMVEGPWMVPQLVAWARMIRDNARTETFSGAVARTFDGKHPCRICKRISRARSAVAAAASASRSEGETKVVAGGTGRVPGSPASRELSKSPDTPIHSPGTVELSSPRFSRARMRSRDEFAPARRSEPRTPPPRAVRFGIASISRANRRGLQ